MKEIETYISPLVESMFPSFYREEGPNFIAFVKAYFEWLENGHQYMMLNDVTNFNVGDTVEQVPAIGTIIAVTGNYILVRNDTIEGFRCKPRCGDLTEITSSSGGITTIELISSLNPLYRGRNLMKYGDIDETTDEFIIRFKEKYLKNIQFDVATNKELLVKNAQDLYRSKGTERSIDLFFKLVYAQPASVYYPGDDLMRLSDGEWVRPRYLEITDSRRAVSFLGKQIKGLSSGATAFAERLISKRVTNTNVNVLYISNITGKFVNGESLVINGELFPDSPKVVGSLNRVEIIAGGADFDIGDIVSFVVDNANEKGARGLGRVSSITNKTGVVDFNFIDGGFGYTVDAEAIISEKVLTLTNVRVSNTLANLQIISSGSGYDNTDIVIVQSPLVNATAVPVTDDTGAIVELLINKRGVGFTSETPTVVIANSTGGSSAGSSASIFATSTYFSRYFETFEGITQPLANVQFANTRFANGTTTEQVYANGYAITQYVSGNSGTTTATGTILDVRYNVNQNDEEIGELLISVNSGTFTTTKNIYLANGVSSNITNVDDRTATSRVVDYSSNVTISVLSSLTFDRGQSVYQVTGEAAIPVTFNTDNTITLNSHSFVNNDIIAFTNVPNQSGVNTLTNYYVVSTTTNNFKISQTISGPEIDITVAGAGVLYYGTEHANGIITQVSYGSTTTLRLENCTGVFVANKPIYVRGTSQKADCVNVSFNLGIYDMNETHLSTNEPYIESLNQYTEANVQFVSTGSQATFSPGEIGDIDTVFIGTDLLSSNNGNGAIAFTNEGRKSAVIADTPGFDNTDGKFVYQYYNEIALTPSSAINPANGFITLQSNAQTKFVKGDMVQYFANGVNSITDLDNEGYFFVAQVEPTGIVLSYDTNLEPINNTNFVSFANNIASLTTSQHFIRKIAFGEVFTSSNTSLGILGKLNDFTVSGGTPSTTVYANSNIILYSNTLVNAAVSSVSTLSPINVANQEFMTVPINSYAYGFRKNPQGDYKDIIFSCLTNDKFDLGVIGSITGVNPGENYNIDPFVIVHQPFIAEFNKRDYIIDITPTSNATFIIGERILQTDTIQQVQLNVVSTDGFVEGERVYQGADPIAPDAAGTIFDIGVDSIIVEDIEGTFITSADIISYANNSITENVIAVANTSRQVSAKGIVKIGSNTSSLSVKRLTFNTTFEEGKTVTGVSSGATALIISVNEDQQSDPIGLNAVVEANVITSDGTATGIQVIDSGFGYSNSSVVQFVSSDGLRAGTAKLIRDGAGAGQGFYRNTKGFLSSNKYIHDGDYYQEFSYEVLTRLPFDKYAEIFKKVMHTAGTKVFGSVVLTEETSLPVRADSLIYEEIIEAT